MDVLIDESMIQLKSRSDVRILMIDNSSGHFRHCTHDGAMLIFEMIKVILIIECVLVIISVIFNRQLLHFDDLLLFHVSVLADDLHSIIVHFIYNLRIN